MKHIQHIFFDLDHTIWDFEKNSTEAIHELFNKHNLHEFINSFDDFISDYHRINEEYWNKYNHGLIDKYTVRYGRFIELFELYNIQNAKNTGVSFADEYIVIAPHKTNLFPDAHDVLNYLKSKYNLHLITNGFKEVIDIKIDKTDLRKYFDLVLSAEDVGHNKPHPLVFQTAMYRTNSLPEHSLMIGDSYEADIIGAKNVGMSTIFFNPKKQNINPESVEIHRLRELMVLL